MTRKRFIKLIMSTGVGRNAAEALTWIVWMTCPSYAKAWEQVVLEGLREKKEALRK